MDIDLMRRAALRQLIPDRWCTHLDVKTAARSRAVVIVIDVKRQQHRATPRKRQSNLPTQALHCAGALLQCTTCTQRHDLPRP